MSSNSHEEIGVLSLKKHTSQIIEGIENYFLEIKIKKDFVKELKARVDLNLKRIDFDFSGIDTKNSLHDYLYFKYDEINNFEKLDELAKQIEKLDYVDYCCVAPDTSNYRPLNLPLNASVLDIEHKININKKLVTPNFTPLQTYLNEPNGMNVRNVWSKKISGSKAIVRHLDFGIYKNHEDLKKSNITVVNSRPETEDCNHGTASTGCIVATNNDFGVTGIAYGCQYYFYDTGDLDLIVNDAQVGDIVSLDIQFSISNQLLPVTISRVWWERIKILVDKGATVILAAGNGGLDLSKPGVMENFGDNGSMLVGACYHDTGKRVSFSNYNQETSLINSWGDWTVVTTGYGTLQELPGNDRNYSNNYSGTSSATPLCSGALALIQDYAKSKNIILSAWQMREIIKSSNYTEGVPDGIGYRPNVDYLLKKVDGGGGVEDDYPKLMGTNKVYCSSLVSLNQFLLNHNFILGHEYKIVFSHPIYRVLHCPETTSFDNQKKSCSFNKINVEFYGEGLEHFKTLISGSAERLYSNRYAQFPPSQAQDIIAEIWDYGYADKKVD